MVIMTENKEGFLQNGKNKGILLCFLANGNDWPGNTEAIRWAFVGIHQKKGKSL
jgi:hypothetical protein